MQQPWQIQITRIDGQVVDAAGIAGGFHAQLAGRVSAQHIRFQDAVPDDVMGAGGDALAIVRRAAQALAQMRLFVDADERGEDRLAQMVEQEAGFAVEAAAADRADEMPDQPAGHVGGEHHRALPRAQSLRVQPPHRALGGFAAHRLGGLQIGGVAGHRPPVVALHVVVPPADHRTPQAVAARRIPVQEA